MHHRLKKYIPWLLTALCMLVMLSFSSQEAESSASLSGDITALLMRLFTGAEPDRASDSFELAHTMVRKLAHVSEYCLLGLLLGWALHTLPGARSYRFWVLYAVCLSFALADEWLQTGVSGRAGRFEDVLIDMAGVALSVPISLIWLRARRAQGVKN